MERLMRFRRFKLITYIFLIIALNIFQNNLIAQKDKSDQKEDENKDKPEALNSSTYSGLKWRSIGPAYASGRIADFAVNPKNYSEWYVAVASGHIWKTINNGQTFDPVFENYGAYSIGCLAMDPVNSNIVWAGTGENNHQRALGYGNGIYKTLDGGKSWKNMGLRDSRQIGMITIDPRNTDIVFVAAEGSVWGPGGHRGLYKTTDGGKSWKKVLEISENTGVNNVIIDPSNPDIMYVTSEQRRRHVHTKIGGGPESAIYKSTDGGEKWRKVTSGLPSGHIGGMGIAVSQVNPYIVYAIIEAEGETGGFFRSTDKGESWSKMSSHSSSGQYYNEIYCDPVDVDKVYSVETITHVTLDGGKSWKPIGNEERHVDDHAMWINPNNTDHFLIGGDGGIYETYDGGKNYRHISNLPVTQFYRVYVDNEYPFYNVYGGTQDNNSLGGPSRNTSEGGVSSGEWINTLGGDGFWGMVDPEESNIVYSEYQYGNIYRYDKKSGERLYIKPQPKKGELTYKWNWNAPFIISPHSNKRLYIAANKIFRSDNRGESWISISDDLTANIDRNKWPVMGKYWSSDAVAKDISTSLYGMVVSFAESPKKEGLLYAGTDDGLLQLSEDGGKSWTKIESFPGVPANTYVSDILPSNFDENIVYIAFDNHKRDDFKPYLLKSINKGKSWNPIVGNLPLNGTVHTVLQDYKNPDLLFAGTEFGVFFSYNGGENWIQLKSGIPAIAVKDMAIQQRENDLVLATFGRGLYILDDYSPLREISKDFDKVESKIFAVKDALAYIQSGNKYGQGATYYLAKNPEFGAAFTYYLKEIPKSGKDIRREKEKDLFKQGKPIPTLNWKAENDESKEEESYLVFNIKDTDGQIIRKLTSKPSKGINRIYWDLRYDGFEETESNINKFNPVKESKAGYLVMPGKYSVSMSIYDMGVYKELIKEQVFEVKMLNNSTLPIESKDELIIFQHKVANRIKVINAAMSFAKELNTKILTIKQTVVNLPDLNPELMKEIIQIEKDIDEILFAFYGLEPKASFEEIPPHDLAVYRRMQYVIRTHYSSTAGLTKTEKEQMTILEEQVPPLIDKLRKLAKEDLPKIEKQLENIDAPWTPGRIPEWQKE